MSLNSLPGSVQQSELVQALEAQLSRRQRVSFEYWDQFKRLREVISAQVKWIQSVFPEFTPHDEELHLSRLFGISDEMLGSARYNKMNAAELFLLACGLYAHDWGMAVGPEEIAYLRNGAQTKPTEHSFTPLQDEAERLRNFADLHGIRPLNEIDEDHLHAYVRETHAWRSGVRVRAFFKVVGHSIPEALECVCQGHWLGFSELDDERRFSRQTPVLGYPVNLRAIALYVRLVDLFDIGDDRTPYAVWRFAAPRNPRARMEWEKHRALSPVVFVQYGDGRAVSFKGRTSDTRVWTELEQLRAYCENQLAGTNDLFARYNDPRHELDLRKVEWAVKPDGFVPIKIRFEFDRGKMFEIFANQIYHGNCHVFIRELLQNSIDAIRMRSELVERSSGPRNVGLGFDDAIRFEVEHFSNGDAIVRCRDYGVGMDEYIVRNYLAVAGARYYQSEEFRHLGLKMDPISRFGIGMFSCFMVADRVEIETYRHNHPATGAKPLLIDIPAVDQYFVVRPKPGEAKVGTLVTVHVLGAKQRSNIDKDPQYNQPKKLTRLQVTEYITEVAGFVPFPIVVDEDGNRTVVLHPDTPDREAQQFADEGKEIEVQQLRRDYPWHEKFQDVDNATKFLRARTFDLRQDLGLETLEGWVSYVMPIDERWHVGMSEKHLEITTLSAETQKEQVIARLSLPNVERSEGNIAPSSLRNEIVYQYGVLVEYAPTSSRRRSWPLPPPLLRVNLRKQLAGLTDAARFTLREGTAKAWDSAIWGAVANHLREAEFPQALLLEPEARLRQLAFLATVYCLTEEELCGVMHVGLWPIVTLKADGQLSFRKLLPGEQQNFLEVPRQLNKAIAAKLGWAKYDLKFNAILSKWCGEEAILFGQPNDHVFLGATRLLHPAVPVRVQFLTAPFLGFAPLPQGEFERVTPAEDDETELRKIAMEDPDSLTSAQRCQLRNRRVFKPEIAAFKKPFDTCFAWGGEYLNRSHPTARALIRTSNALKWMSRRGEKSAGLHEIETCNNYIYNNLGTGPSDELRSNFSRLWSLVRKHKLITLTENPPMPEAEDYVWGSLDGRRTRVSELQWPLYEKWLRPFGQTLASATAEELPNELSRATYIV